MNIESTLFRASEGTATASLRAADIAAGPVRSLLSDLDARGMTLDSLHVVRHGELALDLWRWPHEPARRHTLHSATKSFTATAVGLAIAEGLLRLDDYVAPFFEDRFPSPPGLHMRQMRIRDLLTMQAGNTSEISGVTTRLRADGWINDFLGQTVELPPGTHFQYSSMSSHALSSIVTLVTGVAVDEYLVPRLFEPLGITDFAWQRDPEGISSGGNGLSVRAVDLLKFGILYLQDGVWEDRRLLPEDWVAQAPFPHVRRAHARGYGFHFWCFPRDVYAAEGRFGQNCLVFPAQDAVVCATSSMGEDTYGDLPGLMLDAFAEAFATGAARNCAEDEGWIAERVATDRRARPLPSDPGPAGTTASYRFEPNERGLETIRIVTEPDWVTITLHDERGEHVIRHGLGTWAPGRTGVSVWRLHHSYQDDDASILAGATWAGRAKLTLRWLFAETPFEDEVVLEFAGNRVIFRHSSNINSGDTELPAVTGTLES